MNACAGLFALMYFLSPAPAGNVATGETLETIEDGVALRRRPSRQAPVIMYLKRGRRLKELRRSGTWVKVIVYGTLGVDGWVPESKTGQIRSDAEDGPTGSEATEEPRYPKPKSDGFRFVLVVKGARQSFRVQCAVIHDDGAKSRIRFEGNMPNSYGLNERAVDCRVDRLDQHAGTLSVELYGKQSLLPLGAGATNEAFGCVHVRSDGPWGNAYGRRCSRVVPF